MGRKSGGVEEVVLMYGFLNIYWGVMKGKEIVYKNVCGFYGYIGMKKEYFSGLG